MKRTSKKQLRLRRLMGRMAAQWSVMLGAAALSMMLFGMGRAAAQDKVQPKSITSAQERAQAATNPRGTNAAVLRETWRANMVHRNLPKKGCFHASYPNTEWEEVTCAAPPKYHNPRSTRPKRPNTVGDNNGDYSAQTTGLIKSATGSFRSVNFDGTTGSVQGYIDGGSTLTNNVFMFQINSQFFTTSVCGSHSGCQGWQQFLYSQSQCTQGGKNVPCVFMEYWLLSYGSTCPAGSWQADGFGDCWYNGPATVITPAPTIADLPNMKLTATATSGGTDTVVFYDDASGTVSANGQDSVLDLSGDWKNAEFNVFGDCCSTETFFSNPTTLVIENDIDDGTTNVPACGTDSYTAETNNLTIANEGIGQARLCCPYGGSSPSPKIEFLETNAETATKHTASCGPTALLGDPHLTTADGTSYNFQGAGEYVVLRDTDGAEIQNRMTPVSTAGVLSQSPQDLGLETCVSVNTAVAAMVGRHRVTYEPNINGDPDPSGLQLRVDGTLEGAGALNQDLGSGGRLTKTAVVNSASGPTGGVLAIDFPDGKTLTVTPEWWSGPNVWYLNVDIDNVGLVSQGSSNPSGIAGPIATNSWLPALPNGTAIHNPMPSNLTQRYSDLYSTFGNAWRVTNGDTLFDYKAGTSTSTFTTASWPPQKGPCTAPSGLKTAVVARPVSLAEAQTACLNVKDETLHSNCVADVQATGAHAFGRTYLITERLRTGVKITDRALTEIAIPK